MKLKCFGYERCHLELIGAFCLSSAEPGTLGRSAPSCSLRCCSATERTPSRPCTVPAWPKSTWPVSSEPRWAVSRRILLSIIGLVMSFSEWNVFNMGGVFNRRSIANISHQRMFRHSINLVDDSLLKINLTQCLTVKSSSGSSSS